MGFLSLIPWRVWAGLAIAIAALLAWHRLTAFHERKGYERAKEEVRQQAEAQEQRNRELMRAAELKYVVEQGVRDRFTTVTVREIRHAAQDLAACPVNADTRRLLSAAVACADSASSCGPDLPVPAAARTP